MADITSGTGADSMEDIRDEPALESVGVDPDVPIAQDATEPGQDEEDDEFDDDEDEADEDEDADDEDEQKASDTETE